MPKFTQVIQLAEICTTIGERRLSTVCRNATFYTLELNHLRQNKMLFVAVFLGCTSFLLFYVQELPKAQPAVVLVLKRLRRRGNGLKSHPTDWEKPGIEPATPGLQDIGLSPTPRRLQVCAYFAMASWASFRFGSNDF